MNFREIKSHVLCCSTVAVEDQVTNIVPLALDLTVIYSPGWI